MALLMQAQRSHPVKVPPCPEFSDEQLRSVTAPVRVLAGADSVAFDVEHLAARINEFTPHGTAQLLPEAGHGFSDSHFDECVATIQQMLAASTNQPYG